MSIYSDYGLSRGAGGVPVGVSMYKPSKATYVPSRDNPPANMRTNSMDAFKCPSLDQAGNTRPYWGKYED
jgi:hypothetical protein